MTERGVIFAALRSWTKGSRLSVSIGKWFEEKGWGLEGDEDICHVVFVLFL